MELSLTQMIGLMAPPLFLYPFAMVSLGRWQQDSLRFHLLNFIGAIAILISLLGEWNLPIFILECCWLTISFLGIWRAVKRRRG
jgi:hypothetical protein